jgi:paraquat-inducible protein B
MSEHEADTSELDTIPDVAIKSRSGLSIIWLIPLAAVLIGGWIAYKTISERGPIITIAFKNAEGIEAGKTKIKFMSIEIGVVKSVQISEDLSHVDLTAELAKGSEAFMREDTLFWVVRPRLGVGEISGVATLFSGVYVAVYPGKKETTAKSFVGLRKPPIISADIPGQSFALEASTLGSLDIGSPVYYRQIEAGKVLSYEMDEDGEIVHIKVFVYAPYNKRVQKNSRFWKTSGLEFSLGAEGIRVNTQSMVSLLYGGIAFETPKNFGSVEPAEAGHVFTLYESRDDSRESKYKKKEYYVAYFDRSVKGLKPGAPVEFRGMRVGEVSEIKLELHTHSFVFRIPVLIEIEPERISMVGEEFKYNGKILDELITRGLRAQLKTTSLLTGQLSIDLKFRPQASPAAIVYDNEYPVLPTIPPPWDELTTTVTKLIQNLETLPIQRIGSNLSRTLEGTDRLMNSSELPGAVQLLNETLRETQQLVRTLDSRVAPEAKTTLEQLQKTLGSAESALNSNSPLRHDLATTLQEISAAARSIRLMADYLERHPDALIYGKSGKQP